MSGANHEQTWAKLERMRKEREIEDANRRAKRFLWGVAIVLVGLIIASIWID